jgi:RNA polymerase sigma-70 factor (ECF subfamily)
MLRTSTDAQIIANCSGDPDRFREIFERHYGSILSYARRRVGSQIAEDLAVETFAVALRRLDSYDLGEPDARRWLFGIATNLLRHQIRGEQRRLLAYARSGVDPVAGTDPGFDAAESRAQSEADGPVIPRALADLRPQEREVAAL